MFFTGWKTRSWGSNIKCQRKRLSGCNTNAVSNPQEYISCGNILQSSLENNNKQ